MDTMFPPLDPVTATARVAEAQVLSPACVCEKFAGPLREEVSRIWREAEDGFISSEDEARLKWELWPEINRIEESCEADVCYPQSIIREWYGRDTLVSTDAEKQAELWDATEDDLAAQSSADETESRWEGEYEAYALEDAYTHFLTKERRQELGRVIAAIGGNPRDPQWVAWVRERVAKRNGRQLSGYCSCLGTLARKYQVDVTPMPRMQTWLRSQASSYPDDQ
jgi:hypothetical protein